MAGLGINGRGAGGGEALAGSRGCQLGSSRYDCGVGSIWEVVGDLLRLCVHYHSVETGLARTCRSIAQD